LSLEDLAQTVSKQLIAICFPFFCRIRIQKKKVRRTASGSACFLFFCRIRNKKTGRRPASGSAGDSGAEKMKNKILGRRPASGSAAGSSSAPGSGAPDDGKGTKAAGVVVVEEEPGRCVTPFCVVLVLVFLLVFEINLKGNNEY
jgi:hypothetical protein